MGVTNPKLREHSRSKWGLIVGNRAHSLLLRFPANVWLEGVKPHDAQPDGRNALLSKAVVDSLDDQSNGRYGLVLTGSLLRTS